MIPYAIAPLKDVTVLVTRPAAQNASLCALIESKGGQAVAFPTIAIEPIEPQLTSTDSSVTTQPTDWVIFVSQNAVECGLAHVARNELTRFAVIGKSTAAALQARNITPDIVPNGYTSEALLAHPSLTNMAQQTALIVKGVGGRDHLFKTLQERGARVSTLDVYRRVQPAIDSAKLHELEGRWAEGEINIVTLTSVETLENLAAMLTEQGQTLLKRTPFVVVSERVVEAARRLGMHGEAILSRGADDAALVGAIAAWHARAR